MKSRTMFESMFKPLTLLAPLALLLSSGCASFKLKDTPPGLIEVSSSKWDGEAELRMKAPDNVGLNVTTFSNRRGGTLAIWADDMIGKLQERNYVLERQTAVKSGNGLEGTRFDFSYEPPGSDAGPKFYTAVLFVTDKWRVVVQLAGQRDLRSAHDQDLERVLEEIKIRGCKVGSKVCKSGQPKTFDATQKPKPNKVADEGEGEGEGEGEDEGEAAGDANAKPGDVDAAPAEPAPADEG